MNRTEAYELWLDALRSGKYAKTEETLHNAEGYCCLGVLDEVVFGTYWVEIEEGIYRDDQGAQGMLREGRIEAMGLEQEITDPEREALENRWQTIFRDTYDNNLMRVGALASINDLEGSTFEDIVFTIETFGWNKPAETEVTV